MYELINSLKSEPNSRLKKNKKKILLHSSSHAPCDRRSHVTTEGLLSVPGWFQNHGSRFGGGDPQRGHLTGSKISFSTFAFLWSFHNVQRCSPLSCCWPETRPFIMFRKVQHALTQSVCVHFVAAAIISAFVSSQDVDSLAHLADPCYRPYQGHNAFREKYFSGINKRCGREENKSDVNGEFT